MASHLTKEGVKKVQKNKFDMEMLNAVDQCLDQAEDYGVDSLALAGPETQDLSKVLRRPCRGGDDDGDDVQVATYAWYVTSSKLLAIPCRKRQDAVEWCLFILVQ